MAPVPVPSSWSDRGPLANAKDMIASSENRHTTPNSSNLTDLLTWAAKTHGSSSLTFVSSTAAETKDIAWLESSAKVMAYSLVTALGSTTGKKPIVIVYLSSHQDNMLAIWSALYAGFVTCLLPNLTAQLDHRKAHIEHLDSLLTSDSVKPIWLTHQTGSGQLNGAGATGLNIRLFDEIKKATETQELPKYFHSTPSKPDSEAILFLTSGSTGFSKAVVHTHRTILSACALKAEVFKLTPKSATMNWVAFDHVAGSLEMHFAPLIHGCSQVHVDIAAILSDSTEFLRLVDDYKVSVTFVPNFLISKLANDISAKASQLKGSFCLSSLRRIGSGGEAVVTSTVKAFCDALNAVRAPGCGDLTIEMAAGFGMTETCAGTIFGSVPCSLSNPGANLPSSKFLPLGRALLNVEMRIVSPEDGRTILCDGESGELQLRGPMLFVRYYNNPTATQQSFVEGGWFRTGDLGIIERGELRLSGRIKDSIIIHGVSYGIPELETYLQGKEGQGLIANSHLVVAPFRAADQDTESFVVFYAPNFDFHSDNTAKESDLRVAALLQKAHAHIKSVCVKMVTLSPYQIIPIPLEQLSKERTTMGKLSRAKLVKQYSEGVFNQHLGRVDALLKLGRSEKFVKATVGSVAERICKIFEDIFNLEAGSVSAEDNFYEMGGTSIDAIRLKREVEVTMKLPDEIPILRILLHPTPNSLSTLVDQILNPSTSDANVYDPVIPLQTTGNKPPIFFVHPGSGEVLIFINLAKYFHGERPFYAFRTRGFEKGQPLFTSMAEKVCCYADAMQKVQPHGPYAIAGYSYGGIVAYELARVVESRGEEVKFVGLIDIPRAPDFADRTSTDYTARLLFLSFSLGIVTEQGAYDLAEPLRKFPQEAQLQRVFDMAPPQILHELQLSITKFSRWVDITGSTTGRAESYVPSGSVDVLDVFYATPLKGTQADWIKRLMGWQDFCRRDVNGREDGITFTFVPGSHFTLMDLDHVPFFQKIFRERLEARGI